MAGSIEKLGQREVKARLGLRSVVHRHAEARATGLTAVHRDEERVATPGLVVGVDVAVPDEHPVLDRDGGDVARAHTEERVPRRLRRRLHLEPSVRAPPRTPQRQPRREQEALERVVAHVVPEDRIVVAPAQAVGPAILLVGPADGKIGGTGQLAVDDRLGAERRPDNDVPAIAQHLDEQVERRPVDDPGVVHRACVGRTASAARRARRDGGQPER